MDGSSQVGDATQKMKEGVVDLKDAVIDSAAESVEKCCNQTEAFIKDKPFHAILTAFAIGAVAGLILFRR